MKCIQTFCFILLFAHGNAQQKQDTISVYFDLASSSLNNTAMQYLDSLAYYEQLPVYEKYGIIGYADYLGSKESNINLSENRANSIKLYLIGLGITTDKITTVMGKGEVPRDIETNNGYPADRRVDIIVGGFSNLENLKVVKIIPKKINSTKIDITKVKKNETITLKNIFFLPGSHRTRESSTESLFELYITMKDNPSLKINIEGHICCLTNTTHDGYDYDVKEYGLSRNRARAVYDYLISKGIDKNRMNYEGFGISKPLKWPERSLADENKNRRVEIRIIEK